MRQLRSLALAIVLASAACSDGNGPSEDAVFTSVSVGRAFACALTEVATAYCWGARLGDLSTLDSEPRAYGGGQRFRQLSVAQGFSAATYAAWRRRAHSARGICISASIALNR